MAAAAILPLVLPGVMNTFQGLFTEPKPPDMTPMLQAMQQSFQAALAETARRQEAANKCMMDLVTTLQRVKQDSPENSVRIQELEAELKDQEHLKKELALAKAELTQEFASHEVVPAESSPGYTFCAAE